VIVVSGYHGYGNLGDEAILAVLCRDLVSLGVSRSDILAVSGDPAYTRKIHGIEAVDRFAWNQIWEVLGSARLLISGGGSLFQDVTGKLTIPYYLSFVEMALRRKVPVALYGHGIGPIATWLYQKLVARAFRKSAGFTVRDAFSAQFLQQHGIHVPNGAVAVDPVFQLEGSVPRTRISSPPILGLNLRPYPQWQAQTAEWVEILRQLGAAGWELRFLPIGPGDEEMGRTLQKDVPRLMLIPSLEQENCRDELGQLDVFISMRLHGVILGALSGTVPVGLNYDPKVHAACAQIGCRCLELVELQLLHPTVDDVVQNYALNQTAQAAQLGQLREYAYRNRDLLKQVLEG
jgi:polysaccharide pyruvyl transferase CsaB